MNIVSPSILAADFSSLKKDIERVDNAQWLHIDVMDGHFVNNISIGVPVLNSVNKITKQFMDVHLMITDPIKYVEAFKNAGADMICFHIESNSDISETISMVKKLGLSVGLALKPGTPAVKVLPYIEKLDMVLVMTVEPGFGGQSFIDMTEKISEIKAYAKANGKANLHIQVDGGINEETARRCLYAGANNFVAGSYVFGSENPKEKVEILKSMKAE